jgi:hypothetical protein
VKRDALREFVRDSFRESVQLLTLGVRLRATTMRKSMTRWKSGSFYIYSTTVYPDNGDYPWLL